MSYEDILYRPHHVSPKRAAMSMINRAAQFAPFAALTGHEALIQETARLTDRAMELTDSARAELDFVLRSLQEGMAVLVTCFVPDSRKEGGAYLDYGGIVGKVDAYGQQLLLTDGRAVPFRYIASLEIAG